MKVAWSVLVGDARGRLGTVVAQLSRFGPVLRMTAFRNKSRTKDQLLMRASLGSTSQLWRTATMAPYRAAWVILACAHHEHDVFGNDIFKTGLQWFTRCNKNRETFGLPQVLAAPPFSAVGDPGSLTLTYDPGPPVVLEVSASQPPAGDEAVSILATPALSPGILTLGCQQRQLFTEYPATAGPWDILPAWNAKFGDIPPDHQIFAIARYIDVVQGRAGLDSIDSAFT